jgi:molybdopterin synthase catalytic subunit
MQIRLRYFAMIREALGRSEETRETPRGTTAGQLFDALAVEQPRLAALKGTTLLMVNQEYVSADHLLADGDEVALIPPVSGGANETRFRVTTEPLDPRAVEALVAAPDAGAIVTFTGTVRDRARGRDVVVLDYEAYGPAAEKMLATIGAEIGERWEIERVAIVHRTGTLRPGEASVVIAVASPHRAEAFDACRHAIERIKQIVPIWKKEHYADGAIWVGSEAEYQREIDRESVGVEGARR